VPARTDLLSRADLFAQLDAIKDAADGIRAPLDADGVSVPPVVAGFASFELERLRAKMVKLLNKVSDAAR
jgi:hypothetical protein